MKVFSLISFSDHPVPWSSASIPLGRCLTPAPFSDESLWTLHLCLTPPLTHRTMRDRLSHCLDVWRFICLKAQSVFAAECDPVNPAGLKFMIRSVACCGLWKIKGWASCLTRYRETHRVAPRGHVGFGLRFKVKAALRHTVMTESFCIQCYSSSFPMFVPYQYIWEGGCWTHRQISMLECGLVVLWDSRR